MLLSVLNRVGLEKIEEGVVIIALLDMPWIALDDGSGDAGG